MSNLVTNVPGGLARYRPEVRYLLIDEGVFDTEELSSRANLVAALFRLERGADPEALGEAVRSLIEWLGEEEQASLRRAFTVFIKRNLLQGAHETEEIPDMEDLEEVRAMLQERVKEWRRRWWEEGHLRGREEGERKALVGIVLTQLAKKFGPLAPERMATVETLSIEKLRVLGEEIILAKTLDELFE